MEETAQDAMEVAEEKNAETEEDQKSIEELNWAHGVVRHPSGLQLGFD